MVDLREMAQLMTTCPQWEYPAFLKPYYYNSASISGKIAMTSNDIV